MADVKLYYLKTVCKQEPHIIVVGTGDGAPAP